MRCPRCRGRLSGSRLLLQQEATRRGGRSSPMLMRELAAGVRVRGLRAGSCRGRWDQSGWCTREGSGVPLSLRVKGAAPGLHTGPSSSSIQPQFCKCKCSSNAMGCVCGGRGEGIRGTPVLCSSQSCFRSAWVSAWVSAWKCSRWEPVCLPLSLCPRPTAVLVPTSWGPHLPFVIFVISGCRYLPRLKGIFPFPVHGIHPEVEPRLRAVIV